MQLQHGHPLALVNATFSGASAQHAVDMPCEGQEALSSSFYNIAWDALQARW